MTKTYFAYGSNLLFARLYVRCPSIINLGIGRLENHRLSFNKPGGDDSGKCGIEKVATDEYVIGVLYQMNPEDKPVLDKIEGEGHDYWSQPITVQTDTGSVDCFTYYPVRLDEQLPPYDWYKAFVLAGAKQNNFPADYIARLEAVESTIDPNEERRESNFALIPNSASS